MRQGARKRQGPARPVVAHTHTSVSLTRDRGPEWDRGRPDLLCDLHGQHIFTLVEDMSGESTFSFSSDFWGVMGALFAPCTRSCWCRREISDRLSISGQTNTVYQSICNYALYGKRSVPQPFQLVY